MSYLFSSESVSEGHPDKVADQISDALLDQFLAYDGKAHCAIESFVTTGQVVIMGEVRSSQYVDLQTIARRTINNIGYTKAEYQFDGDSCGILSAIHEQSDDINREGRQMTYLRPDAKSQVTVQESDAGIPERIDTIVVSTQHDDFVKPENDSQEAREAADKAMLDRIHNDVLNILIPRVKAQLGEKVLALFGDNIKYYVNPTGKFVIGGPHGDTGLTGRKIIVDTYGGKGAHGGGAFSGKDSSKVDRSAAYAARYIAKNMVAAGVADEMLVQLAYAIGIAEPVSIYVNTYGRSHVKMADSEIAKTIAQLFDLRPNQIEKVLKLRQPMYLETAAYGHMGRKNEAVEKSFTSLYHETKTIKVELFTWEKLDQVERIRKAFGL